MRVDLNADVGEGHDDLPIFPLVSSVSIACGAHAGDEATMTRCVEEAVHLGLAVGAHPGYPDRDGFGRRAFAMRPAELLETLLGQIGGLAAVAARYGTELAHVKPHGALYNQAADDPELAAVVAEAVKASGASLRLYGLAGSAIVSAARDAGLEVAAEAFADRGYLANGRLAPRDRRGALVAEPDDAAAQAVALATGQSVRSVDGGDLRLRADTICVHADTPGAIAIARAVRNALDRAGVRVRRLGSD